MMQKVTKVTSIATIVQRTTWAKIIPTEFSGNKLATDGMPVHFVDSSCFLDHRQLCACMLYARDTTFKRQQGKGVLDHTCNT